MTMCAYNTYTNSRALWRPPESTYDDKKDIFIKILSVFGDIPNNWAKTLHVLSVDAGLHFQGSRACLPNVCKDKVHEGSVDKFSEKLSALSPSKFDASFCSPLLGFYDLKLCNNMYFNIQFGGVNTSTMLGLARYRDNIVEQHSIRAIRIQPKSTK
ncbi:hypothetical protein BYT27DRAFT_7218469 [Phlegmacium glaucopus]|nr:hypothetical protein BYT27DRAFT_7218469 [Phlegmacium glaucopus]